jgi:hypothetical protein
MLALICQLTFWLGHPRGLDVFDMKGTCTAEAAAELPLLTTVHLW